MTVPNNQGPANAGPNCDLNQELSAGRFPILMPCSSQSACDETASLPCRDPTSLSLLSAPAGSPFGRVVVIPRSGCFPKVQTQGYHLLSPIWVLVEYIWSSQPVSTFTGMHTTDSRSFGPICARALSRFSRDTGHHTLPLPAASLAPPLFSCRPENRLCRPAVIRCRNKGVLQP